MVNKIASELIDIRVRGGLISQLTLDADQAATCQGKFEPENSSGKMVWNFIHFLHYQQAILRSTGMLKLKRSTSVQRIRSAENFWI